MSSKKLKKYKSNLKIKPRDFEAKFSDIPVHLSATNFSGSLDSGNCKYNLIYNQNNINNNFNKQDNIANYSKNGQKINTISSINKSYQADIASYFLSEMERLGWREHIRFESQEELLIFEKPHKYLAISIRPLKKANSYQVLISLSSKVY